MANRPDEQDALEHRLDALLLEERYGRVHARHVDVDLVLDFARRVVVLRVVVLLDEQPVVGAFAFQHVAAALQVDGQVAGEQAPRDAAHFDGNAGPAELAEVLQRGRVGEQRLEALQLRLVVLLVWMVWRLDLPRPARDAVRSVHFDIVYHIWLVCYVVGNMTVVCCGCG